MMRTDFPYELYSQPLAVQVATKLTICTLNTAAWITG